MRDGEPATSTEPSRGRPATWARRHRRRIGLLGAAGALALTAVWLVVVPDKADDVGGLQAALIRWGHPACWLLLAVVGLLVAVDGPARARTACAYAALGCYAAFLVAVLI